MKGQLVGLTDWEGQHSAFFYDRAGRHVGTQRPNGLLSDYRYNPAGHLRRIRHFAGSLSSLRAHFEFQVDGRGNRTQAYERMAEPTTITTTYDKDAAEVDYTAGTWTDDGDFKKSSQFSAKMVIHWTGDEGLLTMGTGPDHSRFDIYIGGTLWQSYDGYAPTEGERVIRLPADALLEIRNRAGRNIQSTGHVIRFKQLEALEVTYDERTIHYTYDALSRLLSAEYIGTSKRFDYTFDLAGNRTSETIDSGTPTTYSYNAANQITDTGFMYDANVNLTSDGVNSYTWDRANRLLSMGGIDYAYDGDGRRISQTAASIATKYLLDIQPSLANVLGQTVGTDTSYFIHAPRGIHAMKNPSGAWSYTSQDGLGSVRLEIDSFAQVLASTDYQPFGVLENVQGTFGLPFKFTGEPTDRNELVHLRKRYYVPQLGIFPSLDPFEGITQRPMSLNGYSWVEGNAPNATDATGLCPTNPTTFFDHRCWELAHGLAARFNAPVTNFSWMSYEELELASLQVNVLGTLVDAATVPVLARYEDPDLFLSAVGQYIVQVLNAGGCDPNAGALGLGTVAIPGMGGRIQGGTRSAGGALLLGALGFGIGLGIGALLGVNVLSRTQTKEEKLCDPERVVQWMQNNAQPRPVTQVGAAYNYQRQYCGAIEYVIQVGNRSVVPDNIDPQTCRMIDCKYVNPQSTSSPYLPGSVTNEEVAEMMFESVSDQFSRFGQVINNPNTGLKVLQVFTNNENAKAFFEQLMITHSIAGSVDRKP